MSEPATAGETRRAHELKAAFLRRLAHELRTPLGSMLMLAELLADDTSGRLGEREIGYARKIQRAGAEIRDLIEDVLTLSRIETGAVPVEAGEVKLAQLLADAAAGFDELAGEKPVALATAVDAAAPATAETDRRQLARLLRRLLAHAARATAEGTVTLRLALAGGAIEIAVRDAAPPLPQQRRPAVFEPFQPGIAGLDLAIARALAELLGGSMTLRPEEGPGNTFVLRLPVAGPAP